MSKKTTAAATAPETTATADAPATNDAPTTNAAAQPEKTFAKPQPPQPLVGFPVIFTGADGIVRPAVVVEATGGTAARMSVCYGGSDWREHTAMHRDDSRRDANAHSSWHVPGPDDI